jgi:hypothetical protein
MNTGNIDRGRERKTVLTRAWIFSSLASLKLCQKPQERKSPITFINIVLSSSVVLAAENKEGRAVVL